MNAFVQRTLPIAILVTVACASPSQDDVGGAGHSAAAEVTETELRRVWTWSIDKGAERNIVEDGGYCADHTSDSDPPAVREAKLGKCMESKGWARHPQPRPRADGSH